MTGEAITMIPSKTNFNKYHAFLSKVSLFKDILEKDLTDFFHSMQIKQYHKGEMLTFNAPDHDKCYIVYEGLFKLTKFDENGDEIVIKILDKSDAISPMHFSPHYEVCAEFVKKTTLIYFTKKDIDDFIAKNHQFSTNIIDFLAKGVQDLLLSAEVLQLKSAKEKVGWYLVHAKINNTFELPYSKALIASYLGLKPESFSRALAKLKEEGIVLDNKTIKLLNGDELCKYCDKVIGSDCPSFLTENCAHN